MRTTFSHTRDYLIIYHQHYCCERNMLVHMHDVLRILAIIIILLASCNYEKYYHQHYNRERKSRSPCARPSPHTPIIIIPTIVIINTQYPYYHNYQHCYHRHSHRERIPRNPCARCSPHIPGLSPQSPPAPAAPGIYMHVCTCRAAALAGAALSCLRPLKEGSETGPHSTGRRCIHPAALTGRRRVLYHTDWRPRVARNGIGGHAWPARAVEYKSVSVVSLGAHKRSGREYNSFLESSSA